MSRSLACDGGEEEEKQIRARMVGGWGEKRSEKRAREREAVARGGWETTSPSGLRLPNDPRDRARVTFGPFDSKPRAELSVDAQFGSARPARRKGVIPYVCERRACVHRRTILETEKAFYYLPRVLRPHYA